MSIWNRRDFIRTIGLGAASLTIPSCVKKEGKDSLAEDQGRPNVLFISVDDLNDWIEPLGGHPQAHTPNLKNLASQSIGK